MLHLRSVKKAYYRQYRKMASENLECTSKGKYRFYKILGTSREKVNFRTHMLEKMAHFGKCAEKKKSTVLEYGTAIDNIPGKKEKRAVFPYWAAFP